MSTSPPKLPACCAGQNEGRESHSSSLHQSTEGLRLLFAVPNPSAVVQCQQYWPFQQLSTRGVITALSVCLSSPDISLAPDLLLSKSAAAGWEGWGFPMWVVQVKPPKLLKMPLYPHLPQGFLKVIVMLLWVLIKKVFSTFITHLTTFK